MKAVTIVICNYNYDRFIGQAIDSALAQTYENTRVLVVDDGSTDGSLAIIGRYADKIDIVIKNNGGQVSAYNAAVERLSGDIVIFLDSDDFLYPEAVSQVVQRFEKGNFAKVQYHLDIVSIEGIATGSHIPSSRPPFHCGESLKKGWLYPSPPASGNAYAVANLKMIYPIDDVFQDKHGADFYAIYGVALTGHVDSIEMSLGGYRTHMRNADQNKFETITYANAATPKANSAQMQQRWQVLSRIVERRLGVNLPVNLMDFGFNKSRFVADLYDVSFFTRLSWLVTRSTQYFRSILSNPYWGSSKKAGLILLSLLCFVPSKSMANFIIRFISNPLSRRMPRRL